jgi:UDP-N-acetylglucosamine--N-acetylmuramyl-(pentapeptide) pyrophosphoryl-undecaprenol N-acetylglucosamine transferase
VLHISGERDYWSLKSRLRRDDYRLIPSTDRIGAAYSAADLVLARAGSSVWEIAAAGKPAILVPYPFATADHQAKNAAYFVRAGGAMMIRDLDLNDVPERVRSLLRDQSRLGRMGEAMLRAAKPNAAEEIAEGLIALARP